MDVLDSAIILATKAHEGQKRKFTDTPYILHPLEVASIIATMTDDKELMAAGCLHDTIEDTDIEAEDIKQACGIRVSALVQSETEDKLSDRPASETWLERKEESLLMLKHTKKKEVKIMWLADKLSNLRSFYRSLVTGVDIWSKLNQKDPKMHEWYYRTIAEYVSELSDEPAYLEFTKLIELIFEQGLFERKD